MVLLSSSAGSYLSAGCRPVTTTAARRPSPRCSFSQRPTAQPDLTQDIFLNPPSKDIICGVEMLLGDGEERPSCSTPELQEDAARPRPVCLLLTSSMVATDRPRWGRDPQTRARSRGNRGTSVLEAGSPPCRRAAAGLNLVNPSPLAALTSQQDCSGCSHTRNLQRAAHWREMEEALPCSRFVL